MNLLLLTSLLFLMVTLSSTAQVVINELDTDTPGTDTMEILELMTDNPFTPLDDYVVVFFNGSENGGDSSYLALDLDGFISDVNGIFLMGSGMVSPVPDFILFDSTIQNGADAVAIYEGDRDDFPDGTLATTINLIDALIYDTNDADDIGLMELLGANIQINEGENGNQTSESIQLQNDGTYAVTTPTPGVPNDGSGVSFNGLSINVGIDELNEGNLFTILITTEEEVIEDLSLDFTLDNETFDAQDFSGDTTVFIPVGSSSFETEIMIVDDDVDEGDEELLITFGDIPDGFNRLNDNIVIRVVDNDFIVAPWGTPLNPTFDQVSAAIPSGYYDTIDGLSGNKLNTAIQSIISDPKVVRAQSFADVIDILKKADQSPLNSNQVWLVYSEQQRPKLDFQTSGGSNVGLWNREHTYPRSRGGFDDIEADEVADGIDDFFLTNIDSLRHANSDAHGIRAADGPENSSRGNQDYGEYDGPDGNQGSWQGDVARGIFFLALRYNGLEVVQGNPPNSTVGGLGDLDILLDWHRNDPPDDYEMNRNNVVFTWQFNRNPFIDFPDLVEFVYGDRVGEVWNNPSLSISDNKGQKSQLFPNPGTGIFRVFGITNASVTIIDLQGNRLLRLRDVRPSTLLDITHLPSGIYIAKIEQGDRLEHIKIVKQ